MGLAVGDDAPDFTLAAFDGAISSRRDVSLSEFAGRTVVLVFYPADNSPVCTRQLQSYSADLAEFASMDAQILALSPQDVDSHESFAEDLGGVGFPLLADTDKSVGELFGVVGPLGFYRRSIVVIDADGVIHYQHRALSGLTYRSSDELIDVVRRADT